MYSRQESSELRQTVWTVFGQYMSPVLSAENEKVAWLNYKTTAKNIHFKMEADDRQAIIFIELSHPEPHMQQLHFNQFKTQQPLLVHTLNEEWVWEHHNVNIQGKAISRIYKVLPGVSIFNKDDWPHLISFFKPRLIALDRFWSATKYGFQTEF